MTWQLCRARLSELTVVCTNSVFPMCADLYTNYPGKHSSVRNYLYPSPTCQSDELAAVPAPHSVIIVGSGLNLLSILGT